MFDCCIINHELDLLDIRLNTINDVVEKFVIIESNTTHSGKPKRMWFSENRSRFSAFDHKIIHLVYPGQLIENDQVDTHLVWGNENGQRNHCLEAFKISRPEDGLIFLSDIDEIPRPEALLQARDMWNYYQVPIALELEQCLYYLNYNFQGFKQIRGSYVYNPDVTMKDPAKIGHKDASPSAIRWHMVADGYENDFPTVKNAGWHFSTLGNATDIRYKLESNAHRFCDTEEYKNPDRINQCIQEGSHVYDVDRYTSTKLVRRDTDFLPIYVQQNLDKFAKYILE